MDFKDRKAIYLQIAERICDEILLGLYEEGGRIPSVREYAAKVEVNSNTTARAYEWLQQQEIIFTKRGLGYFVSEGAKNQIAVMRKKEFMEQHLPELVHMMRTLGISVEEVAENMKEYMTRATDLYQSRT